MSARNVDPLLHASSRIRGFHEQPTPTAILVMDSVWLASADVVAVLLAFVGQLILARALLSESYGLFVIAIDLFATYALLDLGLPTLLARGYHVNHRLFGQE